MLKHLQRDNYHKTGCYNLVCPGFVQTHDAIYLGEPFTIVSSYGGPTFDFLTSITRVMFLEYIFHVILCVPCM